MENTKRKKILFAVGAVFLCGVMAFGVIFGCIHKPRNSLQTDDGGMLVTAPNEKEGGVQLDVKQLSRTEFTAYGVSAEADSAAVITATVEPAEAVRTILDWDLSFADKTSAWANGKSVSTYVEITVSENNRSAVLSCKKCFGEQMIVTAVVRNNKALTQTCTVDYKKRVEGVTVGYRAADATTNIYTLGPSVGTLAFGAAVTENTAGAVAFDFDIQTSEAYTIDDTFSTTVYAVFSDAFVNKVKASDLCSKYGYTPNAASTRIEFFNGGWGAASLAECLFDQSGDYKPLNGSPETMNALYRAIDAMSGQTFLSFEIEAVGERSTYSRRFDVSYTVGFFEYEIESITFDRVTIEF